MNHIGTKRYETERLILRPFVESDAQSVFENWASDDEVTKYLTWPGYTPEAATKVLDILFDEVGANCVYAGHDVNNTKSGRVMQKIGMKYEGILRQFGKNNQGIVDCARYSMIKAER